MSIKLIVQIMEEADLPRPWASVLIAMADHADDDGNRCFPSVDRIAWKANYKPRQVSNIIRDMTDAGILTKVRGASRHHPVEYKINMDKSPRKLPFDQWKDNNGRHAISQQNESRDAIPRHLEVQSRNLGMQPIASETSVETSAETSVAKPAKKSTRKTPVHDMPPEWKPKETTRKWAREKGVDDKTIDYQAEKFVDFHLSSGKQFADWNRAFQTWIRNGIEWGRITPKKILPQQELENMDTPTDNHESARERMIREAKEREQNGY